MLDEGSWWWVVVPSPRGLSTPEVFGHFDRMFPAAGEPAPADDLLDAVVLRGDPGVVATRLRSRFAGEADRVALSTPGGMSDDDLAALVEEVGP